MNTQLVPLRGRLGCSTICFRHLPLTQAMDKIQALGFQAIDLGVVSGFCPHIDLRRWTAADAAALVSQVAERKIRVSSLNVSLSGLALRGEEDTVTIVQELAELGARLGVRTITLPVGQAVPEEIWTAQAQMLARRMRSLAQVVEPLGLRISLEAPHTGALAANYEESARLFDIINDRRIGCTFDTSHGRFNDPRPLDEGLAAVGAEILHVHLRDVFGSDFTVTPGKGISDYAAFFAGLQKRGYSGDCNLELECAPGEAEEEVRFASAYLEAVLSGKPLPAEVGHWRTAKQRTQMRLRQIKRNPKAFITGQPWYGAVQPLVRPWVRLARTIIPLPYYRYESRWRKRHFTGGAQQVKLRRRLAPLPGAKRKRVAVLGCGTVGTYMHAPALANLPAVEIVGVCDPNYRAAAALGKSLRCPVFIDPAELVNQTKPDLVANATGESLHSETSLFLLERGIDVFCEKIMAETLASGEKMVRTASERGLVLGVNFNWRYQPGIQKIRELKDSGSLGELCLLRFACHAHVWHHVLDLAVFLGGRAVSVQAQSRLDPLSEDSRSWRRFADELLYLPGVYANALLQTTENVGVSISSSDLWNPKGYLLTLEAVFRHGMVSLSGVNDRDPVGILSSDRPGLDLRLDLRGTEETIGYGLLFKRSVEAFMEAYLNGRRPPTSGEDGLLAMRLERAVVESARQDRKVKLEESISS